MDPTKPIENIAQTLARELPTAKIIHIQGAAGGGGITHVLVPKTFDLKAIDDAALLANPRSNDATASFADGESFLAYVKYHAADGATVWCDFNPATYALTFTAVFDEHRPSLPAWRKHRAELKPRLSEEWKAWIGMDGTKHAMHQIEFATWIEDHEKDFAHREGFPTSLQMLEMATAFEATSDKRIRSKTRISSGGIQLEFVDTENQESVEKMRLFERFLIAIPVFWSMPAGAEQSVEAWPITARLKYRIAAAPTFWYELQRPDLVHQAAAVKLIAQIREGLGSVPLRLGACC